ncbi:hypothetical protein AMTR_s00021p00252210 [Amborella trichopoda]|uniref:Uncharacterized protein n=1 Tax=Amborella trichopoda TaxID=13333 RepID=W1Q0B4_AMBTC|nr:hypothetical protein AMTR_s00021p00252210 [Amborella trichopoda]
MTLSKSTITTTATMKPTNINQTATLINLGMISNKVLIGPFRNAMTLAQLKMMARDAKRAALSHATNTLKASVCAKMASPASSQF